MQRMGIVTDYFETIVSRIELDDWRMKEDICLLAFEKPDEAMEKLEQYQENCLKGKKWSLPNTGTILYKNKVDIA